MDFLFGLILAFVILYILLNFASITISNRALDDTQSSNNSSNLFDTNFFKVLSTGEPTDTNISEIKPFDSSSNNVLNGKMNLEQQSYDYQSQFYTYVQ